MKTKELTELMDARAEKHGPKLLEEAEAELRRVVDDCQANQDKDDWLTQRGAAVSTLICMSPTASQNMKDNMHIAYGFWLAKNADDYEVA